MDKSSIYKLINYNGVYNNEVKSKLKKLLKKYHPDHKNGDAEIFKLINEVKKELENNTVSIKNNDINNVEKKKTLSKEDEKFYKQRINELIYQKEDLENKINNQERIINIVKDEYNNINEKNLFNEEIICKNKDTVKYLFKFKKRYYVYMILILFLLIALLITHNRYILIALIIIIITMSIDVTIMYLEMQKVVKTTSDFITNGLEYRNKAKEKQSEIKEYKQELVDLEHKLNNINNDIRFYKNRLNNKK